MSAIKLNISQSSQLIEQVSTALLDKLYQLASTEGALTNDSDVVGNLSVPTTYEDTVTFLRNRFPNLIIAADGLYIRFADNNVKQLLLNAGIGDGIGITVSDAANANIGSTLNGKTNITTFNEFKYFTKNNSNVGYKINNASALTSIDLTNCTYFPSDCLKNNAVLANFDGTTSNPGVLRIADGTVSIGNYSFQYDNSITEIHFPSTLTSLGRNAFADISSLVKLYFESGSVNINISFDRCNAIYEIHVADIADWCTNMNTDSSIFKSGGHYYEGETEITSLVLPNTVTNIKSRAFQYGAYITSVTFPNTITSIGPFAFDNCTNLVIDDLSLPNLTNIESYAFKKTKVKHVSNLGHITTIPRECFCDCTQLIDLVVPEGATSIGYNGIRGCTSMTTITIPSTLTSTGLYFTANTPIRNVYITDFQAYVNITYNGYSFLGNAGTNGHLYINNIEPTTILPYGRTVNNTTEHTFPQNITEIKDYVLNRVSSLVNVTIPSTVTRIGVDAFRQCSHLTNLTFENNSNLTMIDSTCFEGCDGLQAVNITNFEAWCNTTFGGTTRTSNPARYSKHLYINGVEPVTLVPYGTQPSDNTTFVFPQNMSEIKDSTFSELGLVTITVPDTAVSIGRSSFENCTSLSAVNFTSNSQLTSIGNNSFKGCTTLTSFTIPNNVTSIGKEAFSGCSLLSSVTCLATTPPTLGTNAFQNNASGRKIYVPAASVNAYKTASNWSTYAADIEAIP